MGAASEDTQPMLSSDAPVGTRCVNLSVDTPSSSSACEAF